MPLQATSGAASYDAFGGGVAAVPNYIEDVFSSYLWTTSGSDQTLTTGIDMTKGALTWIKSRSNAFPHILQTGIGGGVLPNNALSTNSTAAYAGGNYRIADSTTGFTMGVDYYTGTPQTAVVWTFRKQPKFFDIVTYTGNSVAGREIAHNLGSVPGCMIVKSTSDTQDWAVYHRSLGNTKRLVLNGTDAEITSTVWNNTTPTSTVFTVSDNARVNSNGSTYVAYIYAHDAGGFGLTGTDNVISCGSYTEGGAGTSQTINLGYEAQWLLIKPASTAGSWYMYDTMRGFSQTDNRYLTANTSGAEAFTNDYIFKPAATGFIAPGDLFGSSANVIYIAIRRGPMKVPSTGSSVYNAILRTGTGSSQTDSGIGFAPDLALIETRSNAADRYTFSRLQGNDRALLTNTSEAEFSSGLLFNGATGTITNTVLVLNGRTYVDWYFGRAPSFFDEVCYTGTGSTLTLNHNLGVVPELMIGKSRSAAGTNWAVYTTSQGTNSSYLNRDIAFGNNSDWSTAPTATQFTVPSGADLNISSQTQVMYLFATCAGVSKVGTYTGTGTTKQVNCGFTGGARFVLIKRADDTGSWYVWDSSRGIVSGNDPYLLLNSTAAEVTNTDYIDTYSAGFEISSTAPSEINASGGTFIFLAIA